MKILKHIFKNIFVPALWKCDFCGVIRKLQFFIMSKWGENRSCEFPATVFRFRKNDCYEQGPNILTLWPEFSSKLAMRGTFLRHRGGLLDTFWSSWCQYSLEIQTAVWVSVIKTHWITLVTLSINVVKH